MKKSLNTYIVRDPDILSGQPIIKGTRIPLKVVIDNLAEGLTTEEIIKSYPSLSVDAIRAVIAFVAASAADDLLLPIEEELLEDK